ncbi:MAG TPA: class II aldolase/adducin family protein [Candidatus Angelobacter sp.]|nr:class II aldolase/adducin family protein [Candidatus Angelobacter sp.]
MTDLKQQVIDACNELVRLGLTTGTSGNVSVRVPDATRVVASPSSVRYQTMRIEDVCTVDLDSGDQVEGDRNPTSELLMHLAVYRARPDAGAVIHAHTLHTTALSLLGRGIPPIMDEQVQLLGGSVSLCPHTLPGSEALASAVVEHLGDRRAVILAHHGMLACGRDVQQALDVCQATDRLARIYLLALAAGEPATLPGEAQELERMYYDMQNRRGKAFFSRG